MIFCDLSKQEIVEKCVLNKHNPTCKHIFMFNICDMAVNTKMRFLQKHIFAFSKSEYSNHLRTIICL